MNARLCFGLEVRSKRRKGEGFVSDKQVMQKDVFERTRPQECASLEQRKKAKELFEEGHGYKFVAKAVGVSMHTVRDWGRRFKRGKFTEEIAGHLFRFGADAHEKVWELRKQGLSLRMIAAQTGVSVSTCREWIERKKAEEEAAATPQDSDETLSI